jgi:proline dehydrogenase
VHNVGRWAEETALDAFLPNRAVGNYREACELTVDRFQVTHPPPTHRDATNVPVVLPRHCAKLLTPRDGRGFVNVPIISQVFVMPILRSAFIALSHNRKLRHFCEHSRLGTRLNSRFIAGMEPDDALRVTEAVNQQGIAVTLDSLGESVTSEGEAHRAAEVYHQLLEAIKKRGLDANISLKLTQMGLEQSGDLAESITSNLAVHAHQTKNFVRIDMEDSRLTQVTLDIVRRIHARSGTRGSVGVVIQAYLYRSESDIEQLLLEGIRVRLCKGAYKESPEVAFPRKSEVDANFFKLSRLLLDSAIYHGIATHDERIITAIKTHAAKQKIDPSRFEFQMLYGVRRDLQRQLVSEGYKVRVYVPFGREWYPYFMRRLAERPANVLFLARNFFRS